MPSVPKSSVRVQLTVSVLLVILLSWVLSSTISVYLVRQDIFALRKEMLARPDLYPNPIPPPHFRLIDFLIGPRQFVARDIPPPRRQSPPDAALPPEGQNIHTGAAGGPPPDPGMPQEALRPPPARQDGQPPRTKPGKEWVNVLFRGLVALLLAGITGVVLGKRFTMPLTELAKGARAYQSGQFLHRIAIKGNNEFTEVADAMNGMAEQVAQQITSLEEDSRRRQQLLADVAHELRGPVMTMRTMAGAMDEGLTTNPERQTRAVQSLVRTSDRMLHLVTDLLELARLDLHELPMHLQPVDLRELAEACLQNHADAARVAGITLHPVVAGEPMMAMVDSDRLAQVLDNLLNNAISYAGEGAEVRITFQAGDPLRIMVTDTGKGIPAKHLPFIFDPFYRTDTARSPKDKHSGLGLRIARGLIEAHGGTLTITSEEGKGTAATISLPAPPHS